MSPSSPLATLLIRSGWISPNVLYSGSPWQRVQRKKLIDEEVKRHALVLPLSEQRRVLLTDTPERRRLDFTVISKRGPQPDHDNLVGGLKLVIDALKRLRLRRVPVARDKAGRKKYTMESRQDGPGFIWDDDPKWLEFGSVEWDRETPVWPEGTKFVHVTVSPATSD